MTTRPVPKPEHHTPPPNPHAGQHKPSATVRRTQTAAIRAAHPGSPPTHATWTPWAPTQREADARLKTEIDSALAELTALVKEADHILDSTYTLADQRAAKLQAEAWAAFKRFMDAAEKTWDGLVTPALAAYDDRLQRAHERYATALGQAESTHRQLLADAQRAQADGRTISGVA
jgi:ElaB/YqjD/DUF883 family membrane-anchored ribosome-binding protein